MTDRIEQQVRSAFPEGAIARVQVLQHSDDPEAEPGQAATRVFFEWPGQSEGKRADPKTVHAFVVANDAALAILRDQLTPVIGWVEFRPESPAGIVSPHWLSYTQIRTSADARARVTRSSRVPSWPSPRSRSWSCG